MKRPVARALRVHATAVVVAGKGVLLRGASGAGKSDLALRLIDEGAKLVADDGVEIAKRGAGLELRRPAKMPRKLVGTMEVRGVGIVGVPSVPRAKLALVVDLVSRDGVERYPESIRVTIRHIRVNHLKLWAFDASAAAKVRLAVKAL